MTWFQFVGVALLGWVAAGLVMIMWWGDMPRRWLELGSDDPRRHTRGGHYYS